MRAAPLLPLLLCVACSDVVGDAADGDAGAGADAAPSAGADAATTVTMNAPGKHVEMLTVDGLARETIVYVPAQARATTPPVVFMLHGSGGDGDKFFNISGWREKADAEGLIVLFPTALVHCYWEDENGDGDTADPGERHVGTKWASGKLGPDEVLDTCTADELAALPEAQREAADHPLADDIAFFRAQLDLLASRYHVDAKRIYVSGFSNGAGMSSRLAVELSDRFAAGAANAGSLSVDSKATRAVPFIFSVGNLDDRFTSKLGVAKIPMTSTLLTDVPAAGAIAAAYVRAFGVTSSPAYSELTISGKKVTRFVYPGSAPLTISVIEGATHEYPNGTNHPIVMADVLWTFFKEYRLL